MAIVITNYPLDGWKNKRKTGDRSCNCGSWMNHWIRFSPKLWPKKCSVTGCDKRATLGAHIFRAGTDTPDSEFIVPMCDSCNKNEDAEFSLKSGLALVSANKSKTCEKNQ